MFEFFDSGDWPYWGSVAAALVHGAVTLAATKGWGRADAAKAAAQSALASERAAHALTREHWVGVAEQLGQQRDELRAEVDRLGRTPATPRPEPAASQRLPVPRGLAVRLAREAAEERVRTLLGRGGAGRDGQRAESTASTPRPLPEAAAHSCAGLPMAAGICRCRPAHIRPRWLKCVTQSIRAGERGLRGTSKKRNGTIGASRNADS